MVKFSRAIINKMQHYIIWASATFRWCPIFYAALPKYLHSPLILPQPDRMICQAGIWRKWWPWGNQVGTPSSPPLNICPHTLRSHTLPNSCPSRVFCFLFQNYLLAPSPDLINSISQGPCSILFIFHPLLWGGVHSSQLSIWVNEPSLRWKRHLCIPPWIV